MANIHKNNNCEQSHFCVTIFYIAKSYRYFRCFGRRNAWPKYLHFLGFVAFIGLVMWIILSCYAHCVYKCTRFRIPNNSDIGIISVSWFVTAFTLPIFFLLYLIYFFYYFFSFTLLFRVARLRSTFHFTARSCFLFFLLMHETYDAAQSGWNT